MGAIALDPRLLRLAWYLLPLAAAVWSCAAIWPEQVDRISDDEVREAARAFALARGEVGLWESFANSVHPPLVPALSALFLKLLPTALALRMPALIAAFAAVLAVVWLGRRLGRPETGLVAGFLVALSPSWWAYGCSISLDVALAGIAAVAAAATAGPRKHVLLAVAAAGLAALTKRQGFVLIALAMICSCLPAPGRPGRKTWIAVAGVAACAVTGLVIWWVEGHYLFGSVNRLEELFESSPRFSILTAVAAALVALGYRACPPDARRRLWPLFLFALPLAAAPFIGMYPAPRYFLPVLPAAAVLVAATIWGGLGARPIAPWVASVVAVSIAWAVQAEDLRSTYWPYQRGHREVASWLAAHVQPGDAVLSPEGEFLELACAEEGVGPLRITTVDRTTCFGLEEHLRATPQRTWIVLPLYRDLGWPMPYEQHAAAMGLTPRALVRRDVVRTEARAWETASIESLGPRDGVPVMAILSVEVAAAYPEPDAREPVTLLEVNGPADLRDWLRSGVAVGAGAEGGVSLTFSGAGEQLWVCTRHVRIHHALAVSSWHHHRWLELHVRAPDATLELVELGFVFRAAKVGVRLSELREVGGEGGWRRLLFDLRPLGQRDTSQVHRMSLAVTPSEGSAVRVELDLARIRLLPDGAESAVGSEGQSAPPNGRPGRGQD